MTVTVASIGWPEVGAILPPKRSGMVAPTPGVEAEAHRDGSQIGPSAGALDLALDQAAQDRGVVGRRAAAGIVGRVGHHHGRAVEGQRRVDAASSTSR